MRRNSRLILIVIVVIVMFIVVYCGERAGLSRPTLIATRTPSNTPGPPATTTPSPSVTLSPTPTLTPSETPTLSGYPPAGTDVPGGTSEPPYPYPYPYPVITATPVPSETPFPTPTDTPTLTATPTQAVSDNLLINPDFCLPAPTGGFQGWQRLNDKWRISIKPSNPSLCDWTVDYHRAAEMDHDITGGWVYGDEDYLWQDVTVPISHTQVTFSLAEIQHNALSTFEIRIYGGNESGAPDGAGWVLIWYRPETTCPTAHTGTDWCFTTYTFPAYFPMYRLEFYGHYLSPSGADGVKITKLEFKVQ